MNMNKSYRTAESVCKGHPDKLCDLIADSILDACMRKDRASRVACEVMATKGKIIVAGEITCSEKVDIRFIVRSVLREVGYKPLEIHSICVCTQSKCRHCSRSGHRARSEERNHRSLWLHWRW